MVTTPSARPGTVQNFPNPRRLFQSLRESGYSVEAAIADLIDNSIDGEATRVRVDILPTEGKLEPMKTRVVIADDGFGMDYQTLAEALKLGSDIAKDLGSDLGKYGMGLITASISLARRLTVLTKTSDGELLSGIHDLDEIEESNEFVARIETGAPWEWETLALEKDHGTVVILEVCDQLGFQNAKSLAGHLKSQLGQIFRSFIAAKSRRNGGFHSFISINGDPVYATDPLFLEENKEFIRPEVSDALGQFATVDADDMISIDVDPHDPGKGKEEMRIRIVTLPPIPEGLKVPLGASINLCGIYVMRNEREIASAQTFGIFQKHSWLTQFRAEVHFPAALDRRIGLNWTKHRVEPDQGLLDVLKREIGPHATSERKRRVKEVASEKQVDHKPFEQLIARKAKLLTLPRSPKIERTETGKTVGSVEPKNTQITRSGSSPLAERFRNRCEFKEGQMTAAGPIWEPEVIGRKTIITFNVDHPLWTRFVVEAEDEKRDAALELLHVMAFCMAVGEQNVFGEDDAEKLITMRSQLSNNLRILLT